MYQLAFPTSNGFFTWVSMSALCDMTACSKITLHYSTGACTMKFLPHHRLVCNDKNSNFSALRTCFIAFCAVLWFSFSVILLANGKEESKSKWRKWLDRTSYQSSRILSFSGLIWPVFELPLGKSENIFNCSSVMSEVTDVGYWVLLEMRKRGRKWWSGEQYTPLSTLLCFFFETPKKKFF